MPPTGSSATSAGSTARHAFSDAVPSVSAGNSFRASAPARRAANASLGVATPGRQAMPAAFAASITRASVCGVTTILPPAWRSRPTSAGSITVPAPTSASSPNRSANTWILTNGSGELRGTSRIRKPASTSAGPIATASVGRKPRRTATSGSSATARVSRSCIVRLRDQPRARGDGIQAVRRRLRIADRGAHACVLQSSGVERGESAAAQDHDLARAGREGGRDDLGADQDAAKIAAEPRGLHLRRQPERPGAEQVMEQPAGGGLGRGPGAAEAAVEGGGIVTCGRHQAAENAVAYQQLVHLARHVGGEPRDSPPFAPSPLAVSAGQHVAQFPVATGGSEVAQDLRFLAPHHVGKVVRTARPDDARNEMYAPAAIGADGQESCRQFAKARRTGHVGDLAPALPAAHHARGHDGQRRLDREPVADGPLQDAGEIPAGNLEDPGVARPLLEDAGPPDAIGAKARRAPVDDDQRGRLVPHAIVPTVMPNHVAQGWAARQSL